MNEAIPQHVDEAHQPAPSRPITQIGRQAAEGLIERVDGIAGGAEHWITEQADGPPCHRAILPESA
jgi:hypothetical protein